MKELEVDIKYTENDEQEGKKKYRKYRNKVNRSTFQKSACGRLKDPRTTPATRVWSMETTSPA